MQRIEPVFLLLPPVRPGWRDVLSLLTGYIILDWASYIHPLHGLNITPWNPAPALGLLFLLRFGWCMALPLALAIFLADAWVRNLPLSLPISLGLSLLLSLGYLAIAETLRRRLTGAGVFNDRRGLIEWMAIISLGTLLNSLVFAAVLSMANLIPAGSAQEVFFHYWIGDGVGALVSMPLLWMLIDERGRMQLRAMVLTWESPLYLLATGFTLWLTFGVGDTADFKYFYILFMPVIWAAARQGLAGAVFSAAIVQIGIISSVQLLGFSTTTVLEIQILAAEMALFGFFVGVVVNEKLRVSTELRQTLRLAAAGEMTGALAHELNQPLTALSAYGTACEKLLEQGETGERLRTAIRCMIAESYRAADVVRRLRDFFRTGATRLESTQLSEVLAAAATPFVSKAAQQGIQFELSTDQAPDCSLLIDRLQIEVVLRNLLANAFEAVAGQTAGQRSIHITAQPEGAGRVCVRIEDSGPGLSGKAAAHIFEAFHSSKSSGLGLGLVISRAIVEAHGGHLWADVADHGLFRLLLPTEGRIGHAS